MPRRTRVTFTQRNDVDSYAASAIYTVNGNAVVIQMMDEPYPFTFRSPSAHLPLEPVPGRAHRQARPVPGGRGPHVVSHQGVASGRLSGSSGRRCVPRPARAVDPQPPAQRLDPVGQAAQARATRRVGAATTVVPRPPRHQACPALDQDPNLINYRLRLHCAMKWQTHRRRCTPEEVRCIRGVM
jgi:hypothetical protein